MYEVGLAHAARQNTEVLLVRSDTEEINFDLAGIRGTDHMIAPIYRLTKGFSFGWLPMLSGKSTKRRACKFKRL